MDTMKIDMFIGQSESKGQIEGEIQLPMEKNDIEKIYNICCSVNVREKSVANDVIHISGEAEFCVYYITVQNAIESFTAVSAFDHDIDAKGVKPDTDADIVLRMEDCSAVIIDPRTVKAQATVCFIANLCEGSMLPELDTAGLETRSVAVESKCKEGSVSHPFHMSSELRIPGGMDQIESIIGTRCYGIINGIKKDGESAVCFGDLYLNTVYVSDNGVWQICDSFPFEEVIDCEVDLQDKDVIGNIWVKKASASAYDPDVITYSVSAVIRLDIMKDLPWGVVVDAYSLTHNIETNRCHVNMKSPTEVEAGKYTFRGITKSEGMVRPLCIIATPIIKEEYAMEGSVSVEGSLICDILHQLDDGRVDSQRITLPLDENIALPGVRENQDIWTTISVQKASAIISGDEMEIRCPMDVVVCAYSAEEYDMIESVEEKDELNKDGSSIMIYFKDDDEDIFEIAKAHHVCMDDINTENERKLIIMNPAM